MQKIKKIFSFILNRDTLIKVILLQIIILLLVTISGNLILKIESSNWRGFKINGEVELGNSDEAFNIDNHPQGAFQISN